MFFGVLLHVTLYSIVRHGLNRSKCYVAAEILWV
jgi:hypothetical protein